jgi:RNA polymerase sigma factor (sigma-70 family)
VEKIDIEKLYNTYVDDLFKYGSVLSCDRELVKDCIQDVFVNLYMKSDRLNAVVVWPYLKRSLKNKIIDKRIRKYCGEEQVPAAKCVQLCMDDSEMIDAKLSQEYDNKRLMELLDVLSTREREIVILHYFNEVKYADICKIMGITNQSARNLIYRSLNRLRHLALKEKCYQIM